MQITKNLIEDTDRFVAQQKADIFIIVKFSV